MPTETKSMGIGNLVQAIAIGRRPDRTVRRLACLIGIAVIAFLIFRFLLFPIQIMGPSMFPTYKDGQFNFMNTLAYMWHEPKRGDVVGIRFSGDRAMYVKRIVGLPGEQISFSGGACCINGVPLSEPYLKFPSHEWELPPRLLGPSEYYVVGDNRSMAFADHDLGRTPRNRIIGKILLPGTS
jgi:signal peptidase I